MLRLRVLYTTNYFLNSIDIYFHIELINALAGEEELTPVAALAGSQKILRHSIDMHSAKQLHDMMVDEREVARQGSQAELSACSGSSPQA